MYICQINSGKVGGSQILFRWKIINIIMIILAIIYLTYCLYHTQITYDHDNLLAVSHVDVVSYVSIYVSSSRFLHLLPSDPDVCFPDFHYLTLWSVFWLCDSYCNWFNLTEIKRNASVWYPNTSSIYSNNHPRFWHQKNMQNVSISPNHISAQY